MLPLGRTGRPHKNKVSQGKKKGGFLEKKCKEDMGLINSLSGRRGAFIRGAF